MKRFVCECSNILNFLFIRLFVKFDMDICFKGGVKKHSSYKACYRKPPEWKLWFQNRKIFKAQDCESKATWSKSKIKSVLGRSYITIAGWLVSKGMSRT